MSQPARPPRILVVEDEPRSAQHIARQLQESGYQTAGTATSATQAIALAGELKPDLVLIDIQLDGPSDGIVAAQTIRTLYELPVVFMSANAADEVLERAKLTEPFGYILKPFTGRELHITLAMALYKHQAESRMRNSARQLKALSRHVLEVQELERRRVAMELHDELGQSLTAIKINLQLGAQLKGQVLADLNQECIHIVEDALLQVRRLATTLRPSMLDDLGLAPALNWIAEQSAGRGGFAVNFHHVRAQARLAPDIETACFRIVQEALTNITRHAQASRVEINLRREDEAVVLSVQDDGIGFDIESMRQRAMLGGSLGVLGMQERASLIGGQLSIQSVPGKGSTVQLTCPWRSHAELL